MESFEKLKDLIKLYSSIERSYENITLCEYCIKEFSANSPLTDLLFLHQKYVEALIANGLYDKGIKQAKSMLEILEKEEENENILI